MRSRSLAVLFFVIFAFIAPRAIAQYYYNKVTSASLSSNGPFSPGNQVTIQFTLATGTTPAAQVTFIFSSTDGKYGQSISTKTPSTGLASATVDPDWPNATYLLALIEVEDEAGENVFYTSAGALQSSPHPWYSPAAGSVADYSSLGFTVTGGGAVPIESTLTSLTRTSADNLTAGSAITLNYSVSAISSSTWQISVTMSTPDRAFINVPTAISGTGSSSGTISIPTGADWVNGAYQIARVALSGPNTFANYGRGDASGLVSTSSDFHIVGGLAYATYPQLTGISLSGSGTVGLGQTLIENCSIIPGSSPVDRITLTFGAPDGTSLGLSSTGAVSITDTVAMDWLNGPYMLQSISITDSTGHSAQYMRNGRLLLFPNGSSISHNINFTNADFAVSGAVSVPPIVTTQPVGGTLQPGQTLALSFSLNGPPSSSVEWYEGKPGDTSDPVSSSASFTPPAPSSTVTYWARITTLYGTVDTNAVTLVVAYPSPLPVIETQPQSIDDVESGNSGTLSVLAVGPGPLTYQWDKNGSAIAGANSPTLHFQPGSVADNGSYTVTVTNANGSATSTPANVTFLAQPAIVVQPVSQTVAYGGTATFSISATGGALHYGWHYANDSGYADNPSINANSEGPTLTLTNVQPDEAGTYAVTVSNPDGHVTSVPVTLTVTNIPTPILAVIPTSYGQINENFYLRTSASNFPLHFTATGLPPGLTISDSGVISGTPTTSGTFNVVVNVSNAGGTDTGSFTLNIASGTYGPVFTTEPTSQTVALYTQVTLSARANGTPSPNVQGLAFQWYFNGAPIMSATFSDYTFYVDSTSKGGDYTVTATGAGGTLLSTVAHITVDPSESAPHSTGLDHDQTIAAGSAVVLSISATGTSPMTFQWEKNSTPIAGATSATYSILNASEADIGRYSVLIKNAYGNGDFGYFSVTVTYAVQPASVTIQTGQTATLSVPASPAVTYQWYQGKSGDMSKPIDGATSATFTTPSLTASTSYWVAVSAGYFSESSASTITVSDTPIAPSLAMQPSSQTVSAGTSVTFAVAASSTTSMTYQWYFNGVAIGGATSADYTIHSTALTDAGSYTAVVTNSAGSVTSNGAVLAVQGAGAPTVESQPQSQTAATGSTIVLAVSLENAVTASSHWPKSKGAFEARSKAQAVTNPSTNYQWYVNGIPISGATNSRLILHNVTTANDGAYSCLITSSSGSTLSSSAALSVTSTANPGRLINLSVITQVRGTLIMGYVIGGSGTSGSENLLIRGIGPALSEFGVTGVLSDPSITLVKQGDHSTLAVNSGWGGNQTMVNTADQATGAFALADPTSHDSALVISVPVSAGGYSVQVTGASGDSGTALAEIYDDTPSYTLSSPRLVNFSCLTQVNGSMAAGFVIGGSTSKTVLVRATGPELAASFGLTEVMPDPQITVRSLHSSTVLASNAGWDGDAQIAAAANAVGAFSLTNALSKDSAVLLTLAPGPYTAQVTSVSGINGIVLIEVYEVQ